MKRAEEGYWDKRLYGLGLKLSCVGRKGFWVHNTPEISQTEAAGPRVLLIDPAKIEIPVGRILPVSFCLLKFQEAFCMYCAHNSSF